MVTLSPNQSEVPHSVRLAQDALRAMGLFYYIPGGLFSVGTALAGPHLLPLGLAAAGLGLACMKVGGDSVAHSRRPAIRWLMIVWASVLAVPWGMLVLYLAIDYSKTHVLLGSLASFPQAALSLIAIAALCTKDARSHFRRYGNEPPFQFTLWTILTGVTIFCVAFWLIGADGFWERAVAALLLVSCFLPAYQFYRWWKDNGWSDF